MAVLSSLITALSATGEASLDSCQTIAINDPWADCPTGTLYVSQTDDKASFTSVQAAVASLPHDDSPQVILIGAGIYTEQVNVTRAGPLTLLGERSTDVKACYADVDSETTASPNNVQIVWSSANHDAIFSDNLPTSVLAVGPTEDATLTGSGPTGHAVPADTPFGNVDFRAYNIDFRNVFAPYSTGPAHALAVGYANTGFYSCGFYSYQDNIYIGKLGNAYMHDAIIAGQTDFLYGFGTMFIDRSTLLLRSCGGGITAWKGTNTTFYNKYGVYISGSKAIASNATVAVEEKGQCSLGRPWNDGHRSLFMETYFDTTILPAGYTEWAGQPNGRIGINTTMAVYHTYGPGNNVTAQMESNVTKIFDSEQAAPYLEPQDVFMDPEGNQPNVAWIDMHALYGKSCQARKGLTVRGQRL